MVPSCSRALRSAATTLLATAALIVLVSPGAWTLDGRAKEEKSAEAAGCPIGVYVTSLRDLDPVGDSFGIDFWVWSVHPLGDNPLESLEFTNAKQIDTRLERTTKRGDREWPRLKATATVLHDWNLTDFPFDRQTLTLDLGIAASDAPACGVDHAGSGYDKGIAPEGWRIVAFDLERHTREMATDFGDPARSGTRSAQEHVLVTVELQRESVVGFVKLVAGVYAAVAIALVSFLMAPDQAPVFSWRMTVLVGALFATVLNMQVGNSVLGSPEEVSLVDKIHIVALAYVFVAAVMAVMSWRDYDSGRREPREAPRPGIAVRVRRLLPGHQRDLNSASRGRGLAAPLRPSLSGFATIAVGPNAAVEGVGVGRLR